MDANYIPPRDNLSQTERNILYRHIYFLIRNYGLQSYCDTDDIFQDVRFAFCTAIDRRHGATIEYRTAFIKKIAFRCVIKNLNAKKKQENFAQNLGQQYSDSREESSTLDLISQAELVREVRAQLTAQENDLIELRIMQGMAWSDICQHYRDQGETWPPDTLRQRYSRIKLKLKKYLIERGISSSDI
jgi:DNA-directed RNA polymerase specialized sigma24 family protein